MLKVHVCRPLAVSLFGEFHWVSIAFWTPYNFHFNQQWLSERFWDELVNDADHNSELIALQKWQINPSMHLTAGKYIAFSSRSYYTPTHTMYRPCLCFEPFKRVGIASSLHFTACDNKVSGTTTNCCLFAFSSPKQAWSGTHSQWKQRIWRIRYEFDGQTSEQPCGWNGKWVLVMVGLLPILFQEHWHLCQYVTELLVFCSWAGCVCPNAIGFHCKKTRRL